MFPIISHLNLSDPFSMHFFSIQYLHFCHKTSSGLIPGSTLLFPMYSLWKSTANNFICMYVFVFAKSTWIMQ